MDADATSADGTASRTLTPRDCAVLLRVLDAEEADVKRRQLLFELALALGGTPALTLLRHLSPAELERLGGVLHSAGRVDEEAVAAIEKITERCRRLDDVHGPGKVLPVVERQRVLVADLLHQRSLLPNLRQRLLVSYAHLTQFAGYLHYDSVDHTTARQRYGQALEAAHEIGDATFLTYLHTSMSSMCVYQKRYGEALDHAFAGDGWARRSASTLMRSLHSMNLAHALAANGRVPDSERAVAASFQQAEHPRSEADPGYVYWWLPYEIHTVATDCMLRWGRPDSAIDAAQQTLAKSIDRTLLHGQTLLLCANALIQKREIPAATSMIKDAAHLTAQHTSARIPDSVRKVRSLLNPWSGNKHVRDLDEELRSLGIGIPASA
ncbi:hypothetical protein AB0K60_17055 [Thermopolyspora sp. NPDC052614]|uniref:hypothetical protein n=1 Tax=Thermopolyspora sp. NPDC052614 TaxID=3155682 RepID=UPI00341D0013